MLVIWIASSNGQHTDALCDSSYSWSYNSLGQTPCLVAAIISTPCSKSGDFHIAALSPGSVGYDPPKKPTECQCNTVHYSLLGACAACQGAVTSGIPWTAFKENCTSTWPDGQFLFEIWWTHSTRRTLVTIGKGDQRYPSHPFPLAPLSLTITRTIRAPFPRRRTRMLPFAISPRTATLLSARIRHWELSVGIHTHLGLKSKV